MDMDRKTPAQVEPASVDCRTSEIPMADRLQAVAYNEAAVIVANGQCR